LKTEEIISLIKVDELSSIPKYKQLTNAIITAIETGLLEKKSMLPSINELSFVLDLSRDTAEKGYRHLRKLGIIESVPGKGYFIVDKDFSRKIKVCLLFNKLSAHKKIIYDAFTKNIGDEAVIGFYIYNNDYTQFKKLLLSKKDEYTHFVIIPHFLDGGENVHELLSEIPKERLVILDKLLPDFNCDYAAVYENFSEDIYTALEQALPQLSNYHTIKIIFPRNSYFPREILNGFYKFCQQYAFTHQVINALGDETISKGEVFITLMEDDLVTLIERLLQLQFKVGKDVGVISYNETPLKKIILDGITTISTDFIMLGEQTARLILEEKIEKIHVPFRLTLRNSL
jgi:DNA-binding transcriptional regulator YhcF (GntR family)